MLTIGLTGGIGVGKSTTASILADLGARVIDADKIAHEIYLPAKPAWSEVVEAFGRGIVAADGTIDRKQLGQRVFAEPDALRRLNAILHPRMAEDIRERIRALRDQGLRAPIVLEAAILIEAGWRPLVDELWVVVASRDQKIERTCLQRGLEPGDVQRRIENQISDEERAAAADCIVQNTGSPSELRAEIERLWRERIRKSAAPFSPAQAGTRS